MQATTPASLTAPAPVRLPAPYPRVRGPRTEGEQDNCGRPSLEDPELRREVMTEFADKYRQELGIAPTDASLESAVDDLMGVADLSDAYEMGRSLERRGWTVDRQLVDVLDRAFAFMHRGLNERVKQWVDSNGIEPKLSIGDAVKVLLGDESAEGTISLVRPHLGIYVVTVPAAGHVGPGKLGVTGSILPFEAFHEIAEPAEEFRLREQAWC